jgi:hypothetical protein
VIAHARGYAREPQAILELLGIAPASPKCRMRSAKRQGKALP